MGSGSSIPNNRDVLAYMENKSREIERELEADQKKKVLKILLLGPGNSGKSTTLKQLRIIHDSGFSDAERILHRPDMYRNVLFSTIHLINTLKVNGFSFTSAIMNYFDVILQFAQATEATDQVDVMPELILHALDKIGNDVILLEALEHFTTMDSSDSVLYFFKEMNRICAVDYTPTEDDILRSRTPTAGVVQCSIVIKKYTFSVIDVGGQKTERRKWIHVFDNVNAVLFIASLSDYNETLAEDSKINCLADTISLFSDICNSPHFDKTAMILFLNKIDLFEKKITRVPINVTLKHYRGAQEYRPSLDYITRKFKQCNKNLDRKIYVHETCATDTRQVEVVIDLVVTTVIDKAMERIGLQ